MEGYIGQIIMFGGNFAPRNWALCDGQLLAISQFQALFSILGTTYGGDGRTTFGLPDLRGRVAMHPGNGPGLTPRSLGQKSGTETNTLNSLQLPAHSHTLNNARVRAVSERGDNASPEGNFLANSGGRDPEFKNSGTQVNMNTGSITGSTDITGNNQSVNNIQPYQCVNYVICLTGTFPSRS